MRTRLLLLGALLGLATALLSAWRFSQPPPWTAAELYTLSQLSLAAMPPLPQDPSNEVADDPRAVALGKRIFYDPRFSGNGQIACATCHVPERYFTDGKVFGQGMGIVSRHTMSLLGAAYSPWFTWDGRADSQWSQALGPLENPAEHGADRLTIARILAEHYAVEYQALFGSLPDLRNSRFPSQASPLGSSVQRTAWNQLSVVDRDDITQVVVNLAKVLAAYQRTLLPQRARFDRYVASLSSDGSQRPGAEAANASFSSDEIAGLRLFIGKAQCINCHNGPLFTNFEFHNTAVPNPPGFPLDFGRRNGVALLQDSAFNCLGTYSDAAPEACGETRFLKVGGDPFDGSFRTPTLRNVAETAPYMHAGQFATLNDVIQHYNQPGFTVVGHSELAPLNLTEREVEQLETFLKTLTGPSTPPGALPDS